MESQFGKQSLDARSLLPVGGPVPGTRPPPPSELEQEEAQEWREIVNRMPATWFTRETWPVLVELCRAIVTSRVLSREMSWLRLAQDQEAFLALIPKRIAVSNNIAALATKLRLTPQSRYDNTTAANKLRKTSAVLKANVRSLQDEARRQSGEIVDTPEIREPDTAAAASSESLRAAF